MLHAKDVTMRTYAITRQAIESCRELMTDPKMYGQISELLEAGLRTKYFRVAIIPDFQEHMGLVIGGPIQYVFPLTDLQPILTELIANGKGDEIVQAFSEAVAKSTQTFTSLFVVSSASAELDRNSGSTEEQIE